METFKMAIRINVLGLVLCVFLLGSTLALEPAAQKEIKTVISTFMDQVSQRQEDWGPVNSLGTKYKAALIPYLEEYLDDPNDRVRRQTYALMIKVGLDANDTSTRQVVVYDLLTKMREEKVARSRNRDFLGSRLLQFMVGDFSTDSKDLLHEIYSRCLVNDNAKAMGEFILLVGVADMKSELEKLRKFIEEQEPKLKQARREEVEELTNYLGEYSNSISKSHKKAIEKKIKRPYWQDTLLWNALRARARMGVKEDIQHCIELVESHPDETYRVIRLLEQLSYVRQPEVVDYLHNYLISDKGLDIKADDVVIKTQAPYAAKALALMLRGFPTDRNIVAGAKIITKCRKWMAEQKQWDIIR